MRVWSVNLLCTCVCENDEAKRGWSRKRWRWLRLVSQQSKHSGQLSPLSQSLFSGARPGGGDAALRAAVERAVLLADRDALGQVARLVHVVPAQQGEVVGQQLQGHRVDHGLQAVGHLRHQDQVAARGGGARGRVVLATRFLL